MSQVKEIVVKAIENFNTYQDEESRIELTSESTLYGKDGVLDSLGLVNLIVEVEESLNSELGTNLVLADEKAFSGRKSPFRTVDSLVDYVESLIEVESNAS